MVNKVPRPDGKDPQAERLREVQDLCGRVEGVVSALEPSILYIERTDENLADCLIALEAMAEQIDRQGADNKHLVDEFNTLRAQLLERLRLIPELQRQVRQESWAGQRLAQDKVLLNDEVQRLAAFVRLLQAELPANKGGGNLRNGEREMQSREWLFMVLIMVATALGIGLGIGVDHIGANWAIWVLGTLGAVLSIVAVVASYTTWGAQQLRPPFAAMIWPPVELDTQQWYTELVAKPGIIKTRPVDGLDAREAELASARADLLVERAELASLIRDLRDEEIGNLVDARNDLRSKWQAHDALTRVVPPNQPAIDAAWDEYNQAIDTLCDAAESTETPSQEIVETLGRIHVLTNAIESSPGGLAATVARLKEEHAAAELAVKQAKEKANTFYTHPRWYWVVFVALILSIISVWDVADVNKIIGQSRVAEKRDPGIFTSGGTTLANPMEGRIVGIPELKIGSKGAITAVRLPDGRIMVFLGAGDISPEAREKIVLSEYSAPSPSGN